MIDWKNNTVVCTTVTGGYDHKASSLFVDGVDYIYFSDGKSPFPIQKPWREIILADENLDNRRRAKRPKLYPHSIDVLNNYKYLIWIDGDMEILKKDFIPEILSYLNNGFVVSPHFDNRNCAYGEATIKPFKYRNEPLDEQINFYRSEGFPENYGLYECGVSARDMTNETVKNLGQFWYEQNITWSFQDQVSLPYCFWKLNYQPDILPKSFRDFGWVRINAHKRED